VAIRRFASLIASAAVLAAGLALVALDTKAWAGDVDPDYRLSSLRVFNRVVLLVKEQYVEPQRIRPKEMLLAALDAVEKNVPEVLVEEGTNEAVVTVGTETRSFRLDDVTSLWELSFALRDVFRFLETRISADVDRREVEYAAVNGMLGKLDPHSVLLEPRFSQEMKLNTKGEFGGLGIVISIRDGGLTVISPIDGTPADRAGMKAQDKIVKIGEESTVNMGLDEAVERLRGKPGTSVVIWILRKGWEEPQRFEIVRAVIKVDSVTHQLLDGPEALTASQTGALAPKGAGTAAALPKLGYVKVKQFQGHTAEDVAAAVAAMEKQAKGKLGGLILDLRNNPGGLLDQSVEVSNLFLKDGVIVVTQEGGQGGERREIRAQTRSAKIDLPLVVLVNGGSASASEIVAGAMKNRGRGIIVGDQTFGKGSVQQLYDFPDQSSLKLTIGQYLTPGDESIQSVGITPDISVLPVSAADKENLNLLPDEHTREEDLERHLDDLRVQKHEARYKLAYLAENLSQEEQERRDASSKFQEDFEIKLARRLLARGPHLVRDQMLEAVKPVIDEITTEEERKIDEALMKLGVDWTRGASTSQKLAMEIVSAEPVEAGSVLKLTVRARNDGTSPLFRVRANTRATIGLFSDHELLYGKLDPGQAREWTVSMKVPKELQSRRDLIRLAFSDESTGVGTRTLGKLDIPVSIKGLPRPRFSYALFIDDTRGGNGDGLLQSGESVDLVVSIKNTGAGASEEPMALLKNLGNSEVFIETGRQKLEALKPGSSGLARFAFKVQSEGRSQKGSDKEKVDLRLQVFDGVTGEVLVERLQFPIKNGNAEVKKKKGVVEATAATSVLAAADNASPVLAKAAGGTRFDAVAEVNGFTRVKIGNLYGYVPSAGVGPSKGKVAASATGEPQGLSFVYGRDPPRISFVGGSVAQVDGDTYTVEARIEDDGAVKDAYVFVGDQKVYFENIRSKGPTNASLRREVKLKPGVNVITVVAREDDEFAQREVLTVFSTKGDALEKRRRGR
jgi:carboxyl-terminal processing protease